MPMEPLLSKCTAASDTSVKKSECVKSNIVKAVYVVYPGTGRIQGSENTCGLHFEQVYLKYEFMMTPSLTENKIVGIQGQ